MLIADVLAGIVGAANVDVGSAVSEDLSHDEALGLEPVAPLAVVRPGSTAEVVAVVTTASEAGIPLTARGSGTGLAGGCIPVPGGIVVSFERRAALVFDRLP